MMIIVDETVQEDGCDKTGKEGQEKSNDGTKFGEKMRQDAERSISGSDWWNQQILEDLCGGLHC